MKPTLGAEVLEYDAKVDAWFRRQYRFLGWSAWMMMQNAFAGIWLAISGGSIEIYAPGMIPRKIARLLSIHHLIAASDATLSDARGGTLGTPFRVSDVVVLSWQRDGRGWRLALRPDDDDLDRLRAALLAAGVHQGALTDVG